MSAIASFRTAIFALLYDTPGVLYTSTEIDQALRWALSEYSLKRPIIRTYAYSVIGTTTVHPLPADFITRHITQVQLYDPDPDNIRDLTFYAYQKDEQWVIETREIRNTGDVLVISYSAVHQIDGLDSAAGTTIPAADETILQIGAAGHAMQILARTRIKDLV